MTFSGLKWLEKVIAATSKLHNKSGPAYTPLKNLQMIQHNKYEFPLH